MAPLLSWDDHEFFVSFAMTLGMQMFFFVLSAAAKSEKAFDFVGGLNFIAVAFYTLAQCGQYYQRQLLATAFVVASRLYLALFLAYRAMARGGDARFDELRNHPLRFVKMWLGQTVWVFLVSAPLIFLNSEGVDAPMGALDYVGIGMCSVGIFYEVVADVQKSKFRSDPANRGTVCASGLWKWTRHPNCECPGQQPSSSDASAMSC
jgi:steroid 5-alpha reductase family enzyme